MAKDWFILAPRGGAPELTGFFGDEIAMVSESNVVEVSEMLESGGAPYVVAQPNELPQIFELDKPEKRPKNIAFFRMALRNLDPQHRIAWMLYAAEVLTPAEREITAHYITRIKNNIT